MNDMLDSGAQRKQFRAIKGLIRCFLGMSVAVLIVINCGCAVAVDHNSPPRLTVELRDGSRVIGMSEQEYLHFHSESLGDFKLAVKDIRSIEFAFTNLAKLKTSKGDVLTVQFSGASFPVKTSFGKVELAATSVRRVTVSGARGTVLHPDGLVALWLGENDGRDETGKHDASLLQGVTFEPGESGLGFEFAGGTSVMSVPDAPELNFGAGRDFSIEAWIKPEHAPANEPPDELTIAYKRLSPDRYNYTGYAFYLANGGQLFFLMGESPMRMGGLIVNGGPDLRDGRFHHVAVTVRRDQTDGGHLYVDGESVLTFDPTTESGSLANSEPLLIGAQTTPGYRTNYKGMMDGVAIYDRALSSSEIREDHDAEMEH